MRSPKSPSPLLLALGLGLSLARTVSAGPYPKDNLHDLGYSFIQERDCAAYCGAENQYCCSAGQACYTSSANNVAYCAAATNAVQAQPTGDGYAVYTYTYTETDLVYRTTTSTSWWQAASPTWVAPASTAAGVAGGAPAICTVEGQTSCGIYCCTSDQECGGPNQCVPRAESSLFPTHPATSTGGSPYRPTSGDVLTATSTASASTTVPFLPPATASGTTLPPALSESGGGGLSPGAIAGIVIGVIAGIALLVLLCFCCIVKAGFDGLLAIFGLGKRKRRSTERVETVERYSRHGSGTASRRENHGGWFGGGRPARVDESRRKKSSGFGGLGAVGAGLAGLALVLGLKRRNEKHEKPARSEISSSYYTDSYTGTSASSASSDRRTRESRRHH